MGEEQIPGGHSDLSTQIFTEYTKHLLEERGKSFEQFDKAVLTLSGGGLALSLTVIANVFPLAVAKVVPLLVGSWILFAVSILVTLMSFVVSQFAYDRQLKLAQEYYLEGKAEALEELNKPL